MLEKFKFDWQNKELIVGLVLLVATAISTWVITYTLIVPHTLADKRIEQAATAYADFGSAFVRLVGLQAAAKTAKSKIDRMSKLSEQSKQASGYDVKEATWTEDQYSSLRAQSIAAEIEYFSAKARIAVYGDPATIEFVKEISGSLDDGAKANLIKAQEAMRAHLGADEVSGKHLQELLFR